MLEAARLDQMHNRRAFSFARHRVGDLGHRISRRVALGHFYFDRIFQIGATEFANLVAECGREKQSLTLRRQHAHDAIEIG